MWGRGGTDSLFVLSSMFLSYKFGDQGGTKGIFVVTERFCAPTGGGGCSSPHVVKPQRTNRTHGCARGRLWVLVVV